MKMNFSAKTIGFTVLGIFVFFYGVGVYWSLDIEPMDVQQEITIAAKTDNVAPVVGYATTTMLIKVASSILDKPGGYLSNDALPPGVLLDNIPSWEFGVLEMVRDMALVIRKDFSRSQSQSLENKHITRAQPKFNIDNKSWAMPSAESEYREAIDSLYSYRNALVGISKTKNDNAQFYARADNLTAYFDEVQKRLGGYSQRLSASVGKNKINTDLAGDSMAKQSSYEASHSQLRTDWLQLDNVFYESRGASWALLHFFKAIEIDFDSILENKNAKISLQQIIRELEASQKTLWSPLVLNGDGFGVLANHSLVMANYISRANAALIDLNELLRKG